MSFCCGLFAKRPTIPSLRPRNGNLPRQQNDSGLQGVEFSPRSSWASSIREVPIPSTENPEIAGYYSPTAEPLPKPTRELRGFYEPEPPMREQPKMHRGRSIYY